MALERNKQFKACEHRPQGVYKEVHDQGGAEHNAEMRRLFTKRKLNDFYLYVVVSKYANLARNLKRLFGNLCGGVIRVLN